MFRKARATLMEAQLDPYVIPSFDSEEEAAKYGFGYLGQPYFVNGEFRWPRYKPLPTGGK